MADAGAGRHDAEVVERALAPAQEELVALAVALYSSATFFLNAAVPPKASTMTEWSMTRSTGTSGLIFFGVAAERLIASRIAARSTTAGTPVKSCIPWL